MSEPYLRPPDYEQNREKQDRKVNWVHEARWENLVLGRAISLNFYVDRVGANLVELVLMKRHDSLEDWFIGRYIYDNLNEDTKTQCWQWLEGAGYPSVPTVDWKELEGAAK